MTEQIPHTLKTLLDTFGSGTALANLHKEVGRIKLPSNIAFAKEADSSIAPDKADLLLFISPFCTNCPGALKAVLELGLEQSQIAILIVDIQSFPKLAQEYGVSSVPFTLVSGGLSLTGVFSVSDLKSVLNHDVPYTQRVFGWLVENGRFESVLPQLLIDRGAEHFFYFWKTSTLSLRIPLMMVAQEVLEDHPACLDLCLPELIKLLKNDSPALRGDTADLLGCIGHPLAIDGLTQCLKDDNEDVVEIAEDALEAINESRRYGDFGSLS